MLETVPGAILVYAPFPVEAAGLKVIVASGEARLIVESYVTVYKSHVSVKYGLLFIAYVIFKMKPLYYVKINVLNLIKPPTI